MTVTGGAAVGQPGLAACAKDGTAKRHAAMAGMPIAQFLIRTFQSVIRRLLSRFETRFAERTAQNGDRSFHRFSVPGRGCALNRL
ncbi:hypothetical protein [Sphingobium ummariense]|nr:hypothetical protein [Sphingobium ummariense]